MTGSSGNVGRLVLRGLVGSGAEVRALSRRGRDDLPEGVEGVVGDLGSPKTLGDALKGVDRVFLFPVPETAESVVERARAAGVSRIVTLSSGAVTNGFDTDFHLPVEQAVEASGTEWTHVRPGEFALNKLWLWGPSIRAERVVREPEPEAAWYPVHERDIADVATEALLGEGHTGRAYTLNGPELVSRREQVAAIAEAIGEPVRVDVVEPRIAREHYLAQGGFAAENADFLLGFEDYSGGEADPEELEGVDAVAPGPVPTSEEVTGRPARTFREWACDHAADFR
nr:NAD(P)H-binding protein [Nocardiopsis ganjiahuensis]